MHKNQEPKMIKLRDNKFLSSLTDQGMVFQDMSLDTEIKVVACEGSYDEWAAYFQTPDTPFGNVADYGNKLPEKVAAEIFPDWAKKFKWRR
jgi:hypothetical protein